MNLSFLRLLLFLLLPALHAGAQYDTAYDAAIARAGLYHLQKDHHNAIRCFEQAFAIQPPDALNAYKAAGAYALDSNAGKAFYYLELALQKGWHDAAWLQQDAYFSYLQYAAPAQWQQLVQNAVANENSFAQTLKQPALRKRINQMALAEQQLRYQAAQTTNDTALQRIHHNIYTTGNENREQAKAILQQYGWPTISSVGKDGQNNFWLLVQHADADIPFQQAALDSMKKIRQSTETDPAHYAFLYDRVQCNLNYPQFYGTQVNWTQQGQANGFRTIAQEEVTDRRRKAIGLPVLAVYALSYGFTYQPVNAATARHREDSLQHLSQSLLDSAAQAYQQQAFPKVYDCYNNASMIAGGMSNEEQLQAAVIFCRIATQTGEQQYKDIALDFLNLLQLRHAISKKSLQQPAFSILQQQPRWAAIYGRLE
ncbi:DUF6624 domain-containing protein [Deminuibacter soli]|uniref:Tetratricopeptide repeat protein n=1 Tax=Deminuibacter soli TaxID=2291815 RepID=A0A3E1NJ68_9BACT|nr:DUF6624 domain-containing protein [Deminuibacter soli]RFM27828.1 hypothetical protein DXN05_14130 [Deminuibacter soli]